MSVKRSSVLCGRSAPPAIREWDLSIYTRADRGVPPGKKNQGREEEKRNTTGRRKAWVSWAMPEGSKSSMFRTKNSGISRKKGGLLFICLPSYVWNLLKAHLQNKIKEICGGHLYHLAILYCLFWATVYNEYSKTSMKENTHILNITVIK